jgi:hypothetical protein
LAQSTIGSIGIVSDDLAEAVQALEAARAGVEVAQSEAARVVADARAEVDRKRVALADAIVAAVRAGRRQRDIVAMTGYSRERIRQITRAAGVEAPDD